MVFEARLQQASVLVQPATPLYPPIVLSVSVLLSGSTPVLSGVYARLLQPLPHFPSCQVAADQLQPRAPGPNEHVIPYAASALCRRGLKGGVGGVLDADRRAAVVVIKLTAA